MATELTKLTLEQRLRLVQDLWESISAESSAVPVNSDHLAEVKARLGQYRIDGVRGELATKVAKEIRGEL